MAEVAFEFTGDEKGAMAALAALERKYDLLEQKIKRTADESKRGNDKSRISLDGVGKALAAQVTGYLSLSTVISGTIAKTQELQRESEQAAIKIEELSRKFRIQAGLTSLESESAKASIIGVAVKNAVPSEQAFDAARQLASSGFSADQAQGPALDMLLRGMAAMNETGEQADAKSLAEAAAAYLASQNMPLNAKGLERVLIPIQRLAEAGNLSLPDLGDVSKVGSVFLGKIRQEEQFAAMAILRDRGMPGAEAATALRNTVQSLTTQALDPKRQASLAALGITPEQVDLKGEDFAAVLDTFAAAKDRADAAGLPTDSLFAKYFQRENVAALMTLMGNRDRLPGYYAAQSETDKFNAIADIGLEGQGPQIQRLKTAQELLAAERDQETALYREALMTQAKIEGISPASQFMTGLEYDMQVALLGRSGEAAARSAAMGSGDEVVALAREQLSVLKAIESKTPGKTINREAGRE